ncbi:MAG: PH domain-containing protein [Thermocrispum sp.]
MSEATDEAAWQQLDRRTLGVTAGVLAGVAIAAGVPTTTGVVNGGGSLGLTLAFVLPGALLLIGGGAFADYLRLRKTFYRVTSTKIELRSGILQRKHRAVHRQRIRAVDITANPLYRVFGVAKVSIGTGEHAESQGSQLSLDAVSRPVAEALRTELLFSSVPAGTAADEEPGERPAIAELDWKWLRYTPFSVWPGVLGLAVCGAAWQVSDWFGLEKSLINQVGEAIREQSLWLLVPLAALVVVVVGLIAALGFFAESWWNYRLRREPGGMFALHRGLLIHRSLSVTEDRLRGIERVEPFGARMVGAGRLEAVATGIKQNRPDQMAEESKVLMPEAPREHADAVAADILREPEPPTSAPLVVHPRAALRRRLTWAFAAVLAIEGVLVTLGATTTTVLLHIAWISAIVLVPLAVFMAMQTYWNLGHGSTGKYLVIRYGIMARRTAALRRSGVIGWTVRQTPLQRRAGLVTIAATTAANSGAYTARDAAENEALGYAGEMVPGLLAPFLERC